jgi:hypothetical protein
VRGIDDVTDLGILATNWQQSLPAARAAADAKATTTMRFDGPLPGRLFGKSKLKPSLVEEVVG